MILFIHRDERQAGASACEDRNLGAGELGLLLYLLSRPDGTGISARLIGLRFRCGPRTIKRLWKRLKALGYLQYEPHSRPPRLIVSHANSLPKGGD